MYSRKSLQLELVLSCFCFCFGATYDANCVAQWKLSDCEDFADLDENVADEEDLHFPEQKQSAIVPPTMTPSRPTSVPLLLASVLTAIGEMLRRQSRFRKVVSILPLVSIRFQHY